MKEVQVSNNLGSYKVYIDKNTAKFTEVLKRNGFKKENKFFVITDDQVYSIYKTKIEELFQGFDYKIYTIGSGEENKTLNTVSNIYEFLISNESDRSNVLVAFGGGIVGDIAGYVAATYMRGMKYISIPTTVISMVDSSVGGKVGYNFQKIKNAIGTFYTPKLVFIAMDFLQTLSNKEFINGIAEVVKYGVIKEKSLLNYLGENLKEIKNLEEDKLLYIIEKSLSIKHEVVVKDFNDSDYRNILNFGHTIGHGIEMVSNHEIHHGFAVSLGILVELKLSEYKLGLNKQVYHNVLNLLNTIGFPTKYKVDNMDLFMYAIKHDKKKENNQIKFSLIENLGVPVTRVVVEEELIKKGIKESIEGR